MASGWRRNAFVLPISAVMLALIIYAVPQNLRYQPDRFDADFPGLDFGITVAHILLATVAIVTVCLNIWPWLRTRHPAVHRWTGRVYVLAALPSALLTLPIIWFNPVWEADIGASATGAAWFVTTLIGYVAIRRGNEPKHRRWMLYSFAMATSVSYGVVLGPILTTPAQFPYLVELVRWAGPLLNLGAVKWWLDRTAAAQQTATVIPFPTAVARDQNAA